MSDQNNQLSTEEKKSDLTVFSEISELQLTKQVDKLVEIMPEHKQMLDIVKNSHPEIHRASSLFYKTQSQFMDNMMTVSGPTPIRNMRQILAEMNRTREALKEATIKLKEKEIELDQKENELSKESLDLRKKKIELEFATSTKEQKILELEIQDLQEKEESRKKLLKTEIVKIVTSMESTRGYISGAIRKLANYTEQYNSIMEKNNLSTFTEADFEREEEKYHIMKAFDQALSAARANPTRTVDEGNMIYFSQIGINGTHAQARIKQYLNMEESLLKDNKAPTHKAQLDFLESMAKEFEGCATKLASAKGMKTVTDQALIGSGDTRLLLDKK